MTTPRFNRAVKVEFLETDITPVTGLRVAFDVDKTDGIRFNHADISIWNMNQTSRAKIATAIPMGPDLLCRIPGKAKKIRLSVGYADNPIQLFTGDIRIARNINDGPDWITEIQADTGSSAANFAITQPTFAVRTKAKVVIMEILEPLGMDIRYTSEADQILSSEILEDFSDSGLAHRIADKFLRRYGLSFTIEEDGLGLVYKPTSPRAQEQARNEENTFSPENGLIGTPIIRTDGIEIRSLLRPRMLIFDKFFVQSKSVQSSIQSSDYAAEYYSVNIRHAGDTHGDDWHTYIYGSYARFGDPYTF
jgi:hypothetical protein